MTAALGVLVLCISAAFCVGFVEVFAATDEILATRVTHSLIARAYNELCLQIPSARKQIHT
jgi:hypothetical protein